MEMEKAALTFVPWCDRASLKSRFILSLSCLRFTGVDTNIISSLRIHIYTKEVFQKVKLYLSSCFLLC